MVLLWMIRPAGPRLRHEKDFESIDAIFERLTFFRKVGIAFFEVCNVFGCFGEDSCLSDCHVSLLLELFPNIYFLRYKAAERAYLIQLLRSF